MVTRLMHLLSHLMGAVLGSVAVGAQMVNLLVCVCLLLLGPAFIVDFFVR
jgi:hypothetical protein